MITVAIQHLLAAEARRAREARAMAEEAQRQLEAKIRYASSGGATTREIAAAVGVTAPRISQILKKGAPS